jgi:predicted DNA-binding protein (MmcQ/YjbR family)
MNIEEFRDYCLSKPALTEGFPFDETTLVFKVAGKLFSITDVEAPFSINLKCDPQRALELREQYPAVLPGYHMNKQHWNTVEMDESIPDCLIMEWIDHSYELVVAKLPKAVREKHGL